MARIVAKTVNGPLDVQYFSVIDTQLEITGMTGMETREVQLADDNGQPVTDEDGNAVTTFVPVDKYVKDESTLRDFAGEEKGLFALLFDHDVTQICDFNYESGN
jgi:hypothetical protein